jgi:phenylalanyl-tRNA synthetase alpha chain
MAEIELSNPEKKILQLISRLEGTVDYKSLEKMTPSQKPEEIRNAMSWLHQKGLIKIDDQVVKYYSLSGEGKDYFEKGLPEKRAVINVREGKEYDYNLSENERKIALLWLKKKGLAEITKEKKSGQIKIELTDKCMEYHKQKGCNPVENILVFLAATIETTEEDIIRSGLEPGLSELKERKSLIQIKDKSIKYARLTEAGQDLIKKGVFLEEDEISQLTPEHIIEHQKGKQLKLRKYHIESFAPSVHGGRRHPLRELMDDVRGVFVEMGFTEIEYDYVQPCFWNMDALFIPQDHPARDIQDTFYLKNPERIPISDKELSQKIKRIHEDGDGTGSEGWKYRWSEEEAERAVLRTHTTVNTIRYLGEHPAPPVKVFSIGRIFRNEATDATHLSELHQIEGIVMEEGASLAMLIGTLKEFYRRIGFPDVEVATSYYPYTEPSIDVYVNWKGRILELGGAGIFRPEVTAPFGVKHSVLAWGLGLERLAMIKWELTDIRDTVGNDLEFLRNRMIVK